MARQFNGRLTCEVLRARLTGESVASAPPPGVAATGATPQPGTDREQVMQWLTLLHLLKGVPFNYLVPDIAMLPAESIRFFQIDNNWIEALLDGAYSIGFAGVSQSTATQARTAFVHGAAARARSGLSRRELLACARSRTSFTPPSMNAERAVNSQRALTASANAPEVLTGFLLRSAVVAGWPGLEVHGFSDIAGANALPIVRLETVAPSLLFCIFVGMMARVDLREPSEAVHFGVDPTGSNGWKKDLRYANGNATSTVGSYTGTNVPVTLRGAGTPPVIPLATLAGSMAGAVWTNPPPTDTNFTAAQFALELVEGVQAVSFQLSSAP